MEVIGNLNGLFTIIIHNIKCKKKKGGGGFIWRLK